MQNLILLVSLPFFLLTLCNSHVAAQSDGAQLPTSLFFYQNPENNLELEDILELQQDQWQPSEIPFNQGLSQSTFWIKVTTPDIRWNTEQLLLEIDSSVLDKIKLYQVVEGKPKVQHTSGDSVDRSIKPFDSSRIIFPIDRTLIAADNSQLLLEIRSNTALSIPMYFWDSNDYWLHLQSSLLPIYAFYGLILGLGLYNLCVFLIVRQIAYLYYCLFAVSLALIEAHYDGVAQSTLWQQTPYLNNAGLSVSTAICFSSLTLFTLSLLGIRIKETGNKVYKCLPLVYVISIVVATSALLQKLSLAISVGLIGALFIALALSYVGINELRKKNPNAPLYVVSWVGFYSFGSLFVFSKLGLLEPSFITENAIKITSSIGAILLSYALAERIRKEEYRATMAMAESHAKSRFLASMSHELRTPMNAILGFSDMLSEKLKSIDDPKILRYLGNINKSGQHLLDLINDLLDLSKAEAGHVDVHPQAFELAQIARSVVEELEPLAKKKNLSLSCITTYNDSVINSDPKLIKQVLTNLISNAIKYTKEGKICVWMAPSPNSSAPQDERTGEGKLFVRVLDTGIGLTQQEIPLLFDSFKRLGDQETKQIQGTGLGLALVKNYIDALHGEIKVKSQKDAGSEFILSIPHYFSATKQ